MKGLGSAREEAADELGCVLVAGAALPAQLAARTAIPAAPTATARRRVILSMVPPVCRRSPWTVRPCDAGSIGAALSAALWPARKSSGRGGATIREWNAWSLRRPLRLVSRPPSVGRFPAG